jgi:hypothetical protein
LFKTQQKNQTKVLVLILDWVLILLLAAELFGVKVGIFPCMHFARVETNLVCLLESSFFLESEFRGK